MGALNDVTTQWTKLQLILPEDRHIDDEEIRNFLMSMPDPSLFFAYSDILSVNNYLTTYLISALTNLTRRDSISDEQLKRSLEELKNSCRNFQQCSKSTQEAVACPIDLEARDLLKFMTKGAGGLILLFLDRHSNSGFPQSIELVQLLLMSFSVMLCDNTQDILQTNTKDLNISLSHFDFKVPYRVSSNSPKTKERLKLPCKRKIKKLPNRKCRNKFRKVVAANSSDSESHVSESHMLPRKKVIDVPQVIEIWVPEEMIYTEVLEVMLSLIAKIIQQDIFMAARGGMENSDLKNIGLFCIDLCQCLHSRKDLCDLSNIRTYSTKLVFCFILKIISSGFHYNCLDKPDFCAILISFVENLCYMVPNAECSVEFLKICVKGISALINCFLPLNTSEKFQLDPILRHLISIGLFHIMERLLHKIADNRCCLDAFEFVLALICDTKPGLSKRECKQYCLIMDGQENVCIHTSILKILWSFFASNNNLSLESQNQIVKKLRSCFPCRCIAPESILEYTLQDFENRDIEIQSSLINYIEFIIWPLFKMKKHENQIKLSQRRRSLGDMTQPHNRRRISLEHNLTSPPKTIKIHAYYDVLCTSASCIISDHLCRVLPSSTNYVRRTFFDTVIKPYLKTCDFNPTILFNFLKCLKCLVKFEKDAIVRSFLCENMQNLFVRCQKNPKTLGLFCEIGWALALEAFAKSTVPFSKRTFRSFMVEYLCQCISYWLETMAVLEEKPYVTPVAKCFPTLLEEKTEKKEWFDDSDYVENLDVFWSVSREFVTNGTTLDELISDLFLSASEFFLVNILQYKQRTDYGFVKVSSLSSSFNGSLMESLVVVMSSLSHFNETVVSHLRSFFHEYRPQDSSELLDIVRFLVQSSILTPDDKWDEAQVRQIYDHCEDLDVSLGYEADSEEILEIREPPAMENPDIILLALDVTFKYARDLSNQIDSYTSCKKRKLSYDSVGQETSQNYTQKQEIVKMCTAVCSCVDIVYSFIKVSPIRMKQVNQLSMPSILLKELQSLKTVESPAYNDLRRTVYKVWAEIVQYGISSNDLRLYFNLYKEDNCQINLLLLTLKFMKTSFIDDPVNKITFLNEPITGNLEPHVQDNFQILSASKCSLACQIPVTLDWSLFSDGVSLSFWIERVQKSSMYDEYLRYPRPLKPYDKSQKLHIISIGYLEQLFTVFMDKKEDILYLVTSSNENVTDHTCIVEPGIMEPGWHYVSISISKIDVRKHRSISIKIIIDGLLEYSKSLKVNSSIVSRNSSSYILIGQQRVLERNHASSVQRANQITFSMGNIFVFRSGIITQNLSLLLMALGKNIVNISVEKSQDIQNLLNHFIDPKLINSSANLAVLFADPKHYIHELQASLLCLYVPNEKNEIVFYHNVGPPVDVIYDTGYPKYEVHKCLSFGDSQYDFQKTTNYSLQSIGGVSQLAFMLGRIIECNAPIEQIMNGFRLFLDFCQGDSDLKIQLNALGGYNFIFRLFANLFHTNSVDILQVVLESCFGCPVLKSQNSRYTLHIPEDVILRDNSLFESIIVHWRYFFAPSNEKIQFADKNITTFELVCSLICKIMDKNHHYGLLNLILLRSVDVFGRLIQLFEEYKLENQTIQTLCDPQLIVKTLTALVGLKDQQPIKLTLTPDDLITRGIQPPDILPEELKDLRSFLLYLQPILYSYLSVHKDNAFYLSQTNFSTKPKQGIDVPNLIHLADGTPDLSSQFQELSVSPSKMNTFHVSFGAHEEPVLESTEDECESAIITGILESIANYLNQTTDKVVIDYITNTFNMDLLVILCGNPAIQTRTTVVKMVRSVLMQTSSFNLKKNFLYMIGHQLARYTEINEELFSECFKLAMFDPDTSYLQTPFTVSFSGIQQLKLFLPLFSILPYTSTNLELCHKILLSICLILKQNEAHLIRFFYKTHIMDSLVLTLHNISHLKTREDSFYSTVLDDIQEILCYFSMTFGSFHLHQAYLTFIELSGHLSLLTRNEAMKCGQSASCTLVCLTVEATVLNATLLRLKAASESVSMQGTLSPVQIRKGHVVYRRLIPVTDYADFYNMDINDSPSKSRTSIDSTKSYSNDTDEPSRSILNCVRGLTKVYAGKHNNGNIDFSHVQDLWDKEVLHRFSDQKLTQTAVTDRFKVVLQKCFDLVFLIGSHVHGFKEVMLEDYCLHLLGFLNHSLSGVVNVSARKCDMSKDWLKFAVQEPMKIHFIHLLLYMTSPKINLTSRKRCLSLFNKNSPDGVATFNIFNKPQYQNLSRLAIFLHFLLNEVREDETLATIVSSILKKLSAMNVEILPSSTHSSNHWTVIDEEADAWTKEISRIVSIVMSRNSSHDERMTDKHMSLYESVKQESSKVTENIIEEKNAHTKIALSNLRQTQGLSNKAWHIWKTIIQASTHEEAVWCFPEKLPKSWKIDETEGPNRTRVRLVRGDLKIDPKLLMPEKIADGLHLSNPFPLQSVLLEPQTTDSFKPTEFLLKEGESLVYSGSVNLITISVQQHGELLVSEESIYFIGGKVFSMDRESLQGISSKVWSADSISEIHLRRYELRECAIEIFTITGESSLLSFESPAARDEVLPLILSMDLPNYSFNQTSLAQYTNQWREGLLTNFEYLTCLNKLAGRTLNDLMQYPVFPFILNQYNGNTINLQNEIVYRNLSRPIAVQDKRKEKQIQKHYEDTLQMNQLGGYHYSSHYSNSIIVLYYLVRLPPFTQLFVAFQGGKFDAPDRTFNDIESTWNLTTRNSTTAVRELIPEFFYLNEMFLNTQGFQFGVCQNGIVVNDVKLPGWAKGDPRNFVLAHRCALESSYVTRHLPSWIDLIFGHKQRGKAAVVSLNVFHPSTYSGNEPSPFDDPMQLEARKTMIKTYGQTPLQIFTEPHPLPYTAALNHVNTIQAPSKVYPEVRGLPRGNFPGSGADKTLDIINFPSLYYKADKMVYYKGEVFILPENTVLYISNKGLHFTIQWKSEDGVLRFKRLLDSTTRTLLATQYYNKVTCCVVDGNKIWCGTECGLIQIFLVSAYKNDGDLMVNYPKIPLMGHQSRVTTLHVSSHYKIALSGCENGKICLWDSNKISFIRSVNLDYTITHLTMSPTLGDWICCFEKTIKYFTINMTHVGEVIIPSFPTAVTFSCAQEGRNINVVGVALDNGEIRFYSTWTLEHVRTIKLPAMNDPATCLLYSPNSQLLFLITRKMQRIMYENNIHRNRLPKMVMATPF